MKTNHSYETKLGFESKFQGSIVSQTASLCDWLNLVIVDNYRFASFDSQALLNRVDWK